MRFFVLLILIISGCNPISQEGNVPISWTEKMDQIPEGIRIFHGRNSSLPLNVWYADIDLNHPNLMAKIISSHDEDQRQTPSELLKLTQASVVLNGGYFIMNQAPTSHVGLLKENNVLLEPASPSVIRDNARYYISRGAIGFNKHNIPDIAWVATRNDSMYYWDNPLNNRPGNPAEGLEFTLASYWDMIDAFHAGPVLVQDGVANVSTEEEVFFNTPIAGVQPRSAVGITKENHLILLVVDGRQPESRGVYLEELATIMVDLSCEEALNLDGGGSSALVTRNGLLNRPVGLHVEREIMSALAIYSDDKE
ncbi:MAG: phosphodiester glycosidase family protein [Candidatus Marinimicrobia bacterium]|nr:phosphodiester glycosidase family protein [Candidatus Neomarinimicrobiota bacterium]